MVGAWTGTAKMRLLSGNEWVIGRKRRRTQAQAVGTEPGEPLLQVDLR